MTGAAVLIVAQAAWLTLWASVAASLVLQAWPTQSGAVVTFLLYCVVGAFMRFWTTVPKQLLDDRVEVPFLLLFIFTIVFAQAELLRPAGHPRPTFNQASGLWFLTGIAWYAFIYACDAVSAAPT